MGRREKPVDHSHPARGRLAEHLRLRRETAGVTYEVLGRESGLSPATLKRAASGRTVPRRAVAEAYVRGCGCGGDEEALHTVRELWRQARVEERGRLAQLSAPRPELISDAADLSRALEAGVGAGRGAEPAGDPGPLRRPACPAGQQRGPDRQARHGPC
ncbi:helix-turn-helix domain-containing protein [Streptomyces sp. NPDC014995]|uniref:helix-turn-helix domain-containing protein n=1 Tax=Streptomyces sp. NPDC014995 TaxID=3364936 RepID=UPI0036F70C6C